MTLAPRTVDELIHHMPVVAERAEVPWAAGFARSITRQSRRRGWRPSPKQEAVMRRLVADLFAYDAADDGDDVVLIEEYPANE